MENDIMDKYVRETIINELQNNIIKCQTNRRTAIDNADMELKIYNFKSQISYLYNSYARRRKNCPPNLKLYIPEKKTNEIKNQIELYIRNLFKNGYNINKNFLYLKNSYEDNNMDKKVNNSNNKGVFVVKLTEQDLCNFAKKYNLIILSSYDEYINVDNVLKWKCRECDFEFKQTISNIKKSKIPCEQCRKNPNIRLNYEDIKEELKTGTSVVVSNNKWNIMKKILWEDIDQFILNDKNTNFEFELSKDKIQIMVEKIFSFLKDKWSLIEKLSIERLRTIKKSILTILLLKRDASIAQFKIVEIAGYSSSNPVKKIREFIGIPLPKELYDNQTMKIRECKVCREVKNYLEFRLDKDGYLRWDCKACENKNRLFLRHEKKFLAALFLKLKKERAINPDQYLDSLKQGFKFDVDINCFDCGLGKGYLPSFQFDHVQPLLKTIEWKKLRDKNISEIIFTLDQEECECICANCHKLREAYVFKQYKDDILTKTIPPTIYVDKRAIENYIKKSILLREFTNGTCPYCGETIDLLPIFETHHPNPLIKQYSWANLRFKEINEIRRIINKEKIIWLCSNCHEILKDKYYSKYKAEIFKKYLNVY